MSQEHPITPAANSLVIRSSSGLVSLPEGGSPALSEIISRSLVHIQVSRALATRHRIGEHELCGPDYGLVCAFAEDLRLLPEEVLRRLLLPKSGYLFSDKRIEDGRFKELLVDRETLPISSIPFVKGLVVERLFLRLQETLSGLDLSMFPNLTKLDCDGNQLSELDLSQVPNLTELSCWANPLTELDLSQVPNLTELCCGGNQLIELDISNLRKLNHLAYDEGKTRLIRRLDQNF